MPAELDRAGVDRGRKPFVASMGIYLFSPPGAARPAEAAAGHRLRQGDHPARARDAPRQAYLFDGYWEDVGTVESFYDANITLTRRRPAVRLLHPRRPIYTRPRFLPASRVIDAGADSAIVCDGCVIDHARSPTRSSASAIVQPGAQRSRDTVLLGADLYETCRRAARECRRSASARRRARARHRRQERAHRRRRPLVNQRGLTDAEGDGYVIRDGIAPPPPP